MFLAGGCANVGGLDGGKADIFNPGIFNEDAVNTPAPSAMVSRLNVARNGDAVETPVMGALASARDDELDFLLGRIDGRNKYRTVAIVAATSHRTEKHQIFTYTSAGVLKNGGIAIDDTSVNRLVNSNIVAGLGEVTEQSYWVGPRTDVIKRNFPESQFVFISVNDEISETKAEMLADALKSYLPENSLVVALADYTGVSGTLPPAIGDYFGQYTREILSNADIYRFGNLPLDTPVTARVLGYYLQDVSAKYPHLVSTENAWQAYFEKGEADAADGESAVYLVSFGDIMLGRYVRHLMDLNGLEYAFEDMDETYLKTNDLLLANLEGPVTEKSVRTTGGMNFGFFPDVVPVLKKYHFDIISQANNHTFDKGKDAFPESFGHLRAGGIIPFGNPNEITEDSMAFVHIRGQKFAFLGLEEVNTKIDDDGAVAKIKEEAEKGYKVIVVPHWGVEYTHKPSKRQVELGHKFIDAGAYAVIAHHPHVVQTIENYNGHPIVYSLGNAIFDQYWSAPTQEGLSVAMKLQENRIEINLVPIKLPGSRFRVMDEAEREEFINRFITWADYTEEEQAQIRAGKMVFEF